MKRVISGFIILIMSVLLSGCTEDDEPQLSTDDLLLFWTDRDGNDEIYMMDTEGMNVTRLTNNS